MGPVMQEEGLLLRHVAQVSAEASLSELVPVGLLAGAVDEVVSQGAGLVLRPFCTSLNTKLRHDPLPIFKQFVGDRRQFMDLIMMLFDAIPLSCGRWIWTTAGFRFALNGCWCHPGRE